MVSLKPIMTETFNYWPKDGLFLFHLTTDLLQIGIKQYLGKKNI